MRRKSLALLAIAVLSMVVFDAHARRRGQPFEGTRWKVTVTPDGDAANAGEKEFTDILVFKGGMFSAETCAKYGFKPTEYHEETAPMGLTATFTAEQKSEKEGTAHWRGTKAAADLTGELTWTKKDGMVLRYTFKGERTK
jgi:hypothetical protein